MAGGGRFSVNFEDGNGEGNGFAGMIATLEAYFVKTENVGEVFQAIGREVMASTELAFSQQQNPSTGDGWPDLAETTVNYREKYNMGGIKPMLKRSPGVEVPPNQLYKNAISGIEAAFASVSPQQRTVDLRIKAESATGEDYAGFNNYGDGDRPPKRQFLLNEERLTGILIEGVNGWYSSITQSSIINSEAGYTLPGVYDVP